MDKQKSMKLGEKPTVKEKSTPSRLGYFSPKVIGALADEVAKTLVDRLPNLMPRRKQQPKARSKIKKLEGGLFLDTSAIIDGRIFDVIQLGLLSGSVVVLSSILLELKHIADSQDAVRRERGRNGLDFLEKVKKTKFVEVVVMPDEEEKKYAKESVKEVDEKLIAIAKAYKGKVVTCDYNLAKKASIQNVTAVNMHALAQGLKIRAVPGEALHIKVLHQGKEESQGVGYLDDGTMIVIENASLDVGRTIDVVVFRVIQTAAGRILFSKKI